MNTLILGLIQLALKLLEPFLKKLLDIAYEKAEEWANNMFGKTGKKPSGLEKMDVAVAEVLLQRPEMDPEAARVLLQVKHWQANKVQKSKLRVAGKTAR